MREEEKAVDSLSPPSFGPPPPVMTWEEIEQGLPGQLNIPGLLPDPTIAERAFLALARKWEAESAKVPAARPVPRSVDTCALACLLLAVEWGQDFSDVSWQQMERNRQAAKERREISWMDQLPWELCMASMWTQPTRSDAVLTLLANLDHHNSATRIWMMEVGWCVIPWLHPTDTASKLLKNVANTLIAASDAGGMAARLFDNPKEFTAFANAFKPPFLFEEQYHQQLEAMLKNGICARQAMFWEMEATCRKLIEQTCLGLRMTKTPHAQSTHSGSLSSTAADTSCGKCMKKTETKPQEEGPNMLAVICTVGNLKRDGLWEKLTPEEQKQVMHKFPGDWNPNLHERLKTYI